jgi:hypothetical protein
MRAARLASLAVLTVLAVPVAGAAFAEDPAPAPAAPPAPKKAIVVPNARCPVTGEPAQEETRVAWGDLEVRLCCPGCIDEFEADPAKFARALLVDLTEQLGAAAKKIEALESRCAEKEKKEKEEKAEKTLPDPREPRK